MHRLLVLRHKIPLVIFPEIAQVLKRHLVGAAQVHTLYTPSTLARGSFLTISFVPDVYLTPPPPRCAARGIPSRQWQVLRERQGQDEGQEGQRQRSRQRARRRWRRRRRRRGGWRGGRLAAGEAAAGSFQEACLRGGAGQGVRGAGAVGLPRVSGACPLFSFSFSSLVVFLVLTGCRSIAHDHFFLSFFCFPLFREDGGERRISLFCFLTRHVLACMVCEYSMMVSCSKFGIVVGCRFGASHAVASAMLP